MQDFPDKINQLYQDKIDQLHQENDKLINRMDFLLELVQKLKDEIAALKKQK